MERTTSRAGWIVFSVALILGFVGTALLIALGRLGAQDPIYFALMASIAAVGALIVSRAPGNVVGRLLLFTPTMSVVGFVTDAYARFALTGGRSLPGGVWASWVSSWAWFVAIAPIVTLLPLLFPSGRFLSPRWRIVGIVCVVAITLTAIGIALTPGVLDMEDVRAINPAGLPVSRGVMDAVVGVLFIGVVLPLVLTAAVSVVVRLRRARGDERQQMRWFASAAIFLTLWILAGAVLEAFGVQSWVNDVLGVFALASVPIATGVAILKYRLYDIDLVIRRALIFGSLAAFATAVYLAIVAGVGAWAGQGNSFLTMTAAVVVAVSFQPLRERITRVANRVVYGRRATPYEVLSAFSERMGGAYADRDVLARMARVLGEGVAAERADVWLRVEGDLRDAASWPPEVAPRRSIALSNGDLPAIEEVDRVYPVEHAGELLGALAVRKPPSDPLTPSDEKLVADLAGQAGLVLSNVRLAAELQDRLDELRSAQKRIVTAQDEQRRKLERNIHDGAQQQLVALAVKARLARTMAGRNPVGAEALVAQIEVESQEALETLRDLARGIYPPLLADKGLAAALEAQARKAPLPIDVVISPGVGRYPQEAEAASYFCCLEALQNVAKSAMASRAEIRIAEEAGTLTFSVSDDGIGFDTEAVTAGTGLQGMADRLAALDGTLEVVSALGAGTVLTGRIPVRAVVPA